jgi:hypothetical protein
MLLVNPSISSSKATVPTLFQWNQLQKLKSYPKLFIVHDLKDLEKKKKGKTTYISIINKLNVTSS